MENKEKIKEIGKEEKDEEIKECKDYLEKVDIDMNHSIDTFDKLIISMSSGGLVFSMGFVKDLLPSNIKPDYTLLKFSWIMFGSAIIINMLSQYFSFKANEYDYFINDYYLRELKGKKQKIDKEKYKCSYNFFNYFIKKFNITSFILFFTAVLLLIIFMGINLKSK